MSSLKYSHFMVFASVIHKALEFSGSAREAVCPLRWTEHHTHLQPGSPESNSKAGRGVQQNAGPCDPTQFQGQSFQVGSAVVLACLGASGPHWLFVMFCE